MTPAALVGRPAAATGEPWKKGCGACRRTYEANGWRALPEVAMLPLATVQAHLTVPAEWTVELRRCACGVVLAIRSA